MIKSRIWTIIPSGGEGARMRPFTQDRSKALMPLVNNFPITEFLIYTLAVDVGLRNFIFAAKGIRNYQDLHNYFQGGSGWSAKLGITPQVNFEYQNPNYHDTGSADATLYCLKRFGIRSPVLVVPCDNLAHPHDVMEMIKLAQTSRHPFIVGLTRVDQPQNYGIAKLAPDGMIEAFIEKPSEMKAPTNLANTFFYLIKPEIFDLLKDDFGQHTLPSLAAAGKAKGYIFKYPWLDFGSPQLHLATTQFLFSRPYPYFTRFLGRICRKVPRVSVWIRGKSRYSGKTSLEILRRIQAGDIKTKGTVIIGKECAIGKNVTLENCSIGDLSIIGDYSHIKRSNLLDAWNVGSRAKISDSLLGRGGIAGDYVSISSSFVADNVNIGCKCRLDFVVVKGGSSIPSYPNRGCGKKQMKQG